MSKKRILSAIVTLGLVLTISNTALAEPVGEMNTLLNQAANQQQQISNDKNDSNKLENQTQSIGTQLEIMDSQIENQLRSLNDNKAQIESTQTEINKTKKDIAKAEIEIEAEQVLFNERMRVMYINGTGGYISVLLDSKNFADFYLKIETIKRVIEYDTKVINDLKDKREIINNKKVLLDKKCSSLLALETENENKMSKLNEAKNSENVIVAQFKSKQNQINARIQIANSNLISIGNKIDNLKKTENFSRGMSILKTGGNSTVTSSGNSTVAYTGSDAVVAYAFKFLNTPYVWGGTTPSGFDCSGFMQYVYAHFGVAIGRDTYAQVTDGSFVSKGQLRPGDLVFFGTVAAPHHVGMYIGNGQFIHAPHTGDVIKVTDLSSMPDYATARRVR